jgi:type I protein arginine methyltransferase
LELKISYIYCTIGIDTFAGLQFYDLIKLVNYIRTEVKNGNSTPDVSSKEKFEDEKYLQPVLEEDALLFMLGDIIIEDVESLETSSNHSQSRLESLSKEELLHQVAQLKAELYEVKQQHSAFSEMAARTLDDRWQAAPGNEANQAAKKDNKEQEYFDSYSGLGKATKLETSSQMLTYKRHSRRDATRQSSYRRLPNLYRSEQGALCRQDRSRCWLWDRNLISFLR